MESAATTTRWGLRLVAALSCEARPLLDHFKLRRVEEAHGLAVYSDEHRLIWLVVSGIGRQAAMTATAYLAGLSEAHRGSAWLNVGIAGHAQLPIGECRMIHKITDAATGETHYPPLILGKAIATAPLVTVSEPQREVISQVLVDMEGSAFYHAASAFSTAELIHCLKVVSDHGVGEGEKPSKASVSALIKSQLPLIEKAADLLLERSQAVTQRFSNPAYFRAIVGEFHFTETQKNQLKECLRRWEAVLGPREDVVHYVWQHAATGQEAIACLRERLDRASLILPHPSD